MTSFDGNYLNLNYESDEDEMVFYDPVTFNLKELIIKNFEFSKSELLELNRRISERREWLEYRSFGKEVSGSGDRLLYNLTFQNQIDSICFDEVEAWKMTEEGPMESPYDSRVESTAQLFIMSQRSIDALRTIFINRFGDYEPNECVDGPIVEGSSVDTMTNHCSTDLDLHIAHTESWEKMVKTDQFGEILAEIKRKGYDVPLHLKKCYPAHLKFLKFHSRFWRHLNTYAPELSTLIHLLKGLDKDAKWISYHVSNFFYEGDVGFNIPKVDIKLPYHSDWAIVDSLDDTSTISSYIEAKNLVVGLFCSDSSF